MADVMVRYSVPVIVTEADLPYLLRVEDPVTGQEYRVTGSGVPQDVKPNDEGCLYFRLGSGSALCWYTRRGEEPDW